MCIDVLCAYLQASVTPDLVMAAHQQESRCCLVLRTLRRMTLCLIGDRSTSDTVRSCD